MKTPTIQKLVCLVVIDYKYKNDNILKNKLEYWIDHGVSFINKINHQIKLENTKKQFDRFFQ